MNRKDFLWKQVFFTAITFTILLFGASFVVSSCGGDDKADLGESCQTNTDCKDGLECRAKRCRTKLPDTAPIAIVKVNPAEAEVGERVQVDGSASNDPEGKTLKFQWTLTVPKGSKAKIAEPKAMTSNFVPDVAGEYKVQLIVDDGIHKSKPSPLITVKVTEGENALPIARAGADQQVLPGAKVTLDGSSSHDPDGDNAKLVFHWIIKSKPNGSKAILDKPNTAKPTFTADLAGRYVLGLVVRDSLNAESKPDDVTVQAIPGLNKVPKITKVDPVEGRIESTINITITGEQFVKGATGSLGKNQFQLTFVDEKKLTARLSLYGATPGDNDLIVTNPNNKSSNAIKFKVLDIPTPELISISPEQGAEGAKSLTLTVKGKNFVKSTEVMFQMTPLATTFKSDTELTANLNLSQTPQGKYIISVKSPGGRVSAKQLQFEVIQAPPPPQLKVLNPSEGKVGTKMDFSVHGIGFSQGAKIVFAGKEIGSKRIRRDEVDADPQLDLTNVAAGDYKVWVRNIDGQDSNKETFTVVGVNPIPSISRVLPFNIFIGEKTNLEIHGARFDPAATFSIGGTNYPINAKRRSSTYMEVTIDATKGTWKPGNYDAIVTNPGNQKSKPFKLGIAHPVPSNIILTPSGWNIGCDTEVMVTGTNFVTSSILYFGSTPFSTTATNPQFKLTFVNKQKMTFKLYKQNLSLTTYKVYISNGPGAQSQPIDFPVKSTSNTPVIRGLEPSSGPADTIVSVKVNGSYTSSEYLLPGAYVELNGVRQPTTCSLSYSGTYCSNITAQVDLNGLKLGKHKITVSNPCGKKSVTAYDFLVVKPPTPYISGVSPAYASVGDDVALIIKGKDIAKAHTLYIDGKKVPTIFKSPSEVVTAKKVDFTTAKAGTIKIYIEHANGQKTAQIDYSILPAKHPLVIKSLGLTVLKQGQSYAKVSVLGSGFTGNTTLTLNGQALAATYQTGAQMVITTLNFTTVKAANFQLQATDGTTKSNIFTLLAEPPPPPTIRYLSPSSAQVDSSSSRYIYVYSTNLCQVSGYGRCPTNPDVLITGPDGREYGTNSPNNRFTISYTYPEYVRGTMNLTGIPAGAYIFKVRLKTGQESNPAIFQLTPPPPPKVLSVYPTIVYRSNRQQYITISGENFVTGDLIIFNNDLIFGRTPGKASSNKKALDGVINANLVRYAGTFPVYVMRCESPTKCDKPYKTQSVNIIIKDPPCAPLGVTCNKDMYPAGSEACATVGSQKICRPVCKTTADCQGMKGAPKTAVCKSGTCQ